MSATSKWKDEAEDFWLAPVRDAETIVRKTTELLSAVVAVIVLGAICGVWWVCRWVGDFSSTHPVTASAVVILALLAPVWRILFHHRRIYLARLWAKYPSGWVNCRTNEFTATDGFGLVVYHEKLPANAYKKWVDYTWTPEGCQNCRIQVPTKGGWRVVRLLTGPSLPSQNH